MGFYGRKTTVVALMLLLSLIGASSFVSACFSQTTSCEGTSCSQGDGGAQDEWKDDLYPPPHAVHLMEGTEWIIHVQGGGGCSDYEELTVTDDETISGWKTSIKMGTISNGDFHYIPTHIPVQEGDDIEGDVIYIGRSWEFDIIYNVTNDGSPVDLLEQVCEVYIVGYDPENQHDYVYVHTNTLIEDSYPIVTVLSPNGNESWGGTHDITWDAVDDQIWPPNPIDIFYSTTGTGGPWTEINGGSYTQDDDGVESWTLPAGVESENCWVKVVATDTKGQESHDINDLAFEIDTVAPTVEWTDPEDDEDGVTISKGVFVQFSEAMDTSSVTITQTGGTNPGGWEWTWTPDYKQITGTHDNWDFGEEVEMTITAGYSDDTDPPNANPTAYVWSFSVTQMEVDEVVIEDEPGGTGDPILDQTVPTDATIQGWAAGYNTTTGDYLGDIEVTWTVDNFNGSGASTSTSFDISSTFDSGSTTGDAIWKICDGEGHQYEVRFEIVVPGVDSVIIMDAPDGEGDPIPDQNINVDCEVLGYSASYNDTYGYIGDIVCDWTVQNFGSASASTSPSSGTSSIFDSGLDAGTAEWRACDGNDHWDTVSFTIIEMVDYILIEYEDGTEIGDVTMTTDDTLDCYARAYNDATGLIGDIAVTWSVYGEIGTVSPTYGKMTTFDATTVGTGYIHACDGNYHTDTTGTITVVHGECSSVALSPEDTTITADMDKQYIATCSDEDDNTWEGTDGVWSENDPVGTITSSGVFDAGKEGKWTIEYIENDVKGTTKVTVKIGSITNIEITPKSWIGTVDDTASFTVMGQDDEGNEQDVTEFTTFTTTDPSGYCNLDVYHPGAVGDWEVEGEFHSLTDSATVTVSAGTLYEIAIVDEYGEEIDDSSLILGDSFEAYVIGYDKNGNQIEGLNAYWESDDDSICELDTADGESTEVTILGSGSCTISTEVNGISASITISIPLDSDKDGLADKWEIEHFDDLYYGADDDPDNDDISNIEEYLHGTDPMVKEAVEGEDSGMYLLIILMIIIIVITTLIVIFLSLRKK